jgi:predicted peptidase
MDAAGPYLKHVQAPPRTVGHHRLEMKVEINGQQVPLICSCFVPKNYSPTGQPSPMMLFLHEYNTIGTPYKDLVLHGPDTVLEKKGNELFRDNFPFVIFSPQIPAGLGDWNQKPVADAVLRAVDELAKAMNVDKTRIYATGLNEGGVAVVQMAAGAPTKFAAIAPIIATFQLPNSPTNNASPLAEVGGLKDLPNWTLVGDASVMTSLKTMYQGKAMWKLTATEKLTAENVSNVYKNKDLYDWMLAQKKAK